MEYGLGVMMQGRQSNKNRQRRDGIRVLTFGYKFAEPPTRRLIFTRQKFYFSYDKNIDTKFLPAQ
mgnify:CR=1 FL=1|jgi:hypothetical protein